MCADTRHTGVCRRFTDITTRIRCRTGAPLEPPTCGGSGGAPAAARRADGPTRHCAPSRAGPVVCCTGAEPRLCGAVRWQEPSTAALTSRSGAAGRGGTATGARRAVSNWPLLWERLRRDSEGPELVWHSRARDERCRALLAELASLEEAGGQRPAEMGARGRKTRRLRDGNRSQERGRATGTCHGDVPRVSRRMRGAAWSRRAPCVTAAERRV